MIRYFGQAGKIIQNPKLLELGLSFLIGLLFGALVVYSPSLPIPSDFQKIVLVIPFAFTLVILFNNLERLLLFAIAISVPLNLDISLLVSQYGITEENIANGRTIVALTSLRVSLTLIIIIIGYLLWFVEHQGQNRQTIRFFPSISIPALGLITISIFSILQAEDTQLAIFKIAFLIELFLMYLYVANHIRAQTDMYFFMTVLVSTMFIESLLMIVQWRTGWGFSIAGISMSAGLKDLRTTGTMGTPDAAGIILSADLALVCLLFWLYQNKSLKIFTGICFITGCIALISTAGRAAWGGFLVAILIILFIGWKHGWVERKSLVWLFIITLVIGGIFFPAIYTRLTENDHGSASSRLLMFQLAWHVIKASPVNFLLGVGANNYALVAPVYNTIIGGLMGLTIQNISVHNVFLLSWAETGFIGLLFFLGFLVAPLLKTIKHLRSNNRFVSMMALGLGCALLVIIIGMLVDPFVARPKMYFTWLLVSLIASLDNMSI